MAALLAASDFKSLAVLGHNLKGSGVSYGFSDLTRIGAALEQSAKQTVRAMSPDLVIIAVPATSTADTDEDYVRAFAWVMNWSLSFGHQEWDCLVVHPTVANPDKPSPRADLIRQLVKAQDLFLIDRPANERLEPEELFKKLILQAW